jgi:hypothetical protein
MKQIYLVAGTLLIMSFMTGCGNKAEKIKVSQLEDACDHVDALISCTEAILDIVDEKEDIYNLSIDEVDQINYLTKKMNLIERHARKEKISHSDMEDCESWKELEDLRDQIENIAKEK